MFNQIKNKINSTINNLKKTTSEMFSSDVSTGEATGKKPTREEVSKTPLEKREIGTSRNTELHKACEAGDISEIERLVNEATEISINKLNDEGLSPLDLLVIKATDINMQKREEIGAKMREKGARFNFHQLSKEECSNKDSKGRMLLHYICMNGKADSGLIELFMDMTSPHDGVDKSGNTPLHYACESGNLRAIEMLVKEASESSINKKNKEGLTPLDLLIIKATGLNKEQKEELGIMMSKKGARFNFTKLSEKEYSNKDSKGRMLLHYICMNPEIKTSLFEEFIAKTNQVNEVDNFGKTPLDYALKAGNKNVIKILTVAIKSKSYLKYLRENKLLSLEKQNPSSEVVTKEAFDAEVKKFLKHFEGVSLEDIISLKNEFSGRKLRGLFFSNRVIANYLARKDFKLKKNWRGEKPYPEYSKYEKRLYDADSKCNYPTYLFDLRSGRKEEDREWSNLSVYGLGIYKKHKPYRYFIHGLGTVRSMHMNYKRMTGKKIGNYTFKELGKRISELNKEPGEAFEHFLVQFPMHIVTGVIKKKEGEKINEVILFNTILMSTYPEEVKEEFLSKINSNVKEGEEIKTLKDASIDIQSNLYDENCFIYGIRLNKALETLPLGVRKELIEAKFTTEEQFSGKNKELIKRVREDIKSKCPMFFQKKEGKLQPKFEKISYGQRIDFFLRERWEYSQGMILHNINEARKDLKLELGEL